MNKIHPRTIQELLALPEEQDPRLGIKTRGYLFHGSPNGEIESLEPRQANHKGLPDGKPAVCAATDPYRSIFISLLNRGHLTAVPKPAARSGWSRVGDQPTIFSATQNLIDAVQEATGYIYLLDPGDFRWIDLEPDIHGPRRELRSLRTVDPLHKIEASISDFPYPIETITLDQS